MYVFLFSGGVIVFLLLTFFGSIAQLILGPLFLLWVRDKTPPEDQEKARRSLNKGAWLNWAGMDVLLKGEIGTVCGYDEKTGLVIIDTGEGLRYGESVKMLPVRQLPEWASRYDDWLKKKAHRNS